MADILRQIETYKRKEIAEAKVRMPLHALERKINEQTPPRGFVKAIEEKLGASSWAPSLGRRVRKLLPTRT